MWPGSGQWGHSLAILILRVEHMIQSGPIKNHLRAFVEPLGKTHFLSARIATPVGWRKLMAVTSATSWVKLAWDWSQRTGEQSCGSGRSNCGHLQLWISARLDPAVLVASPWTFQLQKTTYSLSSLSQLEVGFCVLNQKNPSYYISFLAPMGTSVYLLEKYLTHEIVKHLIICCPFTLWAPGSCTCAWLLLKHLWSKQVTPWGWDCVFVSLAPSRV